MNILVINLGLKNTRAIVYNDKGEEVSACSLSIASLINDVMVEQDPFEWWEKTEKVVREALRDEEIRSEVKYITVTCSSSCLISVDKDLIPLGKAIMVSDKRAVKESEEIGRNAEFLRIRKACHISSDASWMIPKILWVKNNERELFDRTYKFLSPNDFLIAKLTGKIVTDPLNAEKMYYDSKNNRYLEGLISSFGIDIKSLPEVVNVGTNVGKIRNHIKKEFGLKDVEVIVTTYDAIGAIFGSGVTGEEDACDVSGTITSVRALTKHKVNQDNEKIFFQNIKSESLSIVGGTSNQGGSIIEWFKQAFYENKKNPYKVMAEEAQRVGVGADGLIFLPYLLGERVPLWNKDASGVFFGAQRSHKRHNFSRSVFESVGFLTKGILDEIEDIGLKITSLKLSGGLSAINLISKIKADITGKKVYVAHYSEASAFGVFIMVLKAIGKYKNYTLAVKDLVEFREIILPDKENFEKYQEVYSLFKKVYLSLRDSYIDHKKMINKLYGVEPLNKIENL